MRIVEALEVGWRRYYKKGVEGSLSHTSNTKNALMNSIAKQTNKRGAFYIMSLLLHKRKNKQKNKKKNLSNEEEQEQEQNREEKKRV